MTNKIMLAVANKVVREVYAEVFKESGFEIIEMSRGQEAFDTAKMNLPDLVVADIALPGLNGFELLKKIKDDPLTSKIPVIIFTQADREQDRQKAVDLEAKDFIVGVRMSPLEVLLKIKIHLGGQKSYKIPISDSQESARRLALDLGYPLPLECPECKKDRVLFLMRDLSKGPNYFKASFICQDCQK